MDDIIPFIVFVIIAIVNFFTERGKKKRYGKDKLRKPNEESMMNSKIL